MSTITIGDPRLPATFWEKVDVRPGGCWIWTGAKLPWGYGAVTIRGRGGTKRVHRIILEECLGRRMQKSEFACHTCDTPACLNPEHLFVGSHDDNMRDMVAKGRHRGFRRLTPAQAGEIRRRRLSGERNKDLATEFGVSPATVSAITSGKRWGRPVPAASTANKETT